MTKINDAIRTIILADIITNKISQDKKFKIQNNHVIKESGSRTLI